MSPRFGFTQFEYPWLLGPPDGRLVLRAEESGEVRHVVVLRTLGAPERRRLRGRGAAGARRGRPRGIPAGEPAPTPVATSRATVIDAVPLVGLGATDAQSDPYEAAVAALAALNRVIHAHRIATADAYVNPLKLADAIAVRTGYGTGDDVADGRWSEAVELPRDAIERRIRRATSALRPQERLAALLGGRDTALDCEELALRARLDLDAGRLSAATLGVRLAIDTALVELPGRHDLSERLAELRGLRGSVGTAGDEPSVRHALERLEATLRARTARGLDN